MCCPFSGFLLYSSNLFTSYFHVFALEKGLEMKGMSSQYHSHLQQRTCAQAYSAVVVFKVTDIGHFSLFHRFCFLWSCGCVLSERALKEIKMETCHKVGGCCLSVR